MAYLCCLTDSENKISFSVENSIPSESSFKNDKYLEFAKWVSNPHEKQAILTMLNAYTLSDVYMIFSLMEGDLWTPYQPTNVNDTNVNVNVTNELMFDTIEEEPEISDPD